MTHRKKRMIIGISGASGAPLAIKVLQAMQSFPAWETYLCISPAGEETIRYETDYPLAKVQALATEYFPINAIGASIASGSFATDGMLIVPCSMKTLAGIASGYSSNLMLRAADVSLKERRPLVLVTRETPLSLLHLQNMERLSQMGAIILPPVISMYSRPQSIEDLLWQLTGKILQCFDLHVENYFQWNGQ